MNARTKFAVASAALFLSIAAPLSPAMDKYPPTPRTFDNNFRGPRAALLELSPQRRRCLNLYITEELSHQEIAEVMNLSIGAVKSHLHQAKQALRETLKSDFKELDF